jgi:two-component system, cell cycle response regulator
MRLTRKVFIDLAIWQVGFGLCIGLAFPFFVMLLGVSRADAMKPAFFAACLSAGALAGIVSYAISRRVVGARLRLLAERMTHVQQSLGEISRTGDLSACTPENCSIAVDSADEIGESAAAFNRLVEALSASLRTQSAVRAFSDMLTSQLEITSLAEAALHQFVAHAGAAGGLVLYESDGELKVAASRGLRDHDAVAASEHVIATIRGGQRQVITMPDDVLLEGVLADFRPREVRVYPIEYKQVPLGVAVLATPSAFTVEELALIELFLQGLGLALNNAIVHDRLQRLAALDPLTGIYNRRFGLGRLHEEYGRAVRAAAPLGVLMIDIDHFKTVNDTYGHLVGDRVLKSVCVAARASLREGDVLLRFGGEELLAVMPAASLADVRDVGERLRMVVEQTSVENGDQRVCVTVSAGGAAYPSHDVMNEEALIALADQALYRAKDTGRNRVEMAR